MTNQLQGEVAIPSLSVSDDDYLAAIERVREAKLYRDHCLKMLRGADQLEEEAYAELDKIRRAILAETQRQPDHEGVTRP